MPLHPQARDFLDNLAEQNPPGLDELSPAEGREIFAGLTDLFGVGPELHRVENQTIAENVSVRIYAPSAGKLPVLMYFHGGGWVVGDLDTHDALCRRLADQSNCAVVAVDYRRAPEHRYPAALHDCWLATEQIAVKAADFELDASRLVVAGDSAGGNLALGVALRARDMGTPAIVGQVLVYPAVEPGFDTTSYREFAEGYGLTKLEMEWFWRQYLGSDGLGTADSYAVPTRASTLSNLPATHIVTAEFDVLRDEGEDFAAKLRNAGVSTSSKRYDGMIHGFIHFSVPFDEAKQAISDVAKVIDNMVRAK